MQQCYKEGEVGCLLHEIEISVGSASTSCDADVASAFEAEDTRSYLGTKGGKGSAHVIAEDNKECKQPTNIVSIAGHVGAGKQDQLSKVSFKETLTAGNNLNSESTSMERPPFIDVKELAAGLPDCVEQDVIIMSNVACSRRKEFHQFNLVGRVYSNTLTFFVIARLLQCRWGHFKNFRILDLSSGCFCLHIESIEDRNAIWLGGQWQVAG
ncbi:hypothetical protein HPP92_006999 [Vanilla planifolia]|uniref:DUF4283 domain-containing protein n=1 Tax=Vanilla planifolia TaxID=51239 RepID=A0A835VBG2_VANPL|nr:hypothetical protein HPP92_006999 [Vanilla planifolia]